MSIPADHGFSGLLVNLQVHFDLLVAMESENFVFRVCTGNGTAVDLECLCTVPVADW